MSLLGWWAQRQIDAETEAYAKAVAADPDSTPDWNEFASKHSFPYVASAERKNHIVSNYSRLRVGLTKAEVSKTSRQSRLGPQALSERAVEYTGSSWTYCLEKPGAMSNTYYDKLVEVFFDPKGKVHWVTSSGNDLPEIGSPSR